MSTLFVVFAFVGMSSVSVAQQTHRKTMDGRLCANTYTVEGRDFSGCVTLNNPEGVVGREWCTISRQAAMQGSSWGYCAPVIDYGKARKSAQLALEEKSFELNAETATMLKLSNEALSLT